MTKIVKTMLTAAPLKESDIFHKNVAVDIDELQSMGLDVEIQYTANAAGFSALLIGREPRP